MTTAQKTPDLAALSAAVIDARRSRDTLRAKVAELERPITDHGDPAALWDELADLPTLQRDRRRAEAVTERAEAALTAKRVEMRAAVLVERRPKRRQLIGQLDAELETAAQTLAAIVAYDEETARRSDGATMDAIGWTADLLGVDAKLLAWRRFQRDHGWLD